MMTIDEALADARARLLNDFSATVPTSAVVVDALEDALTARREWATHWPDGAQYLPCLVAQDVQEAVVQVVGRWPTCRMDGSHQLHVTPDLGADPHWVCESCSRVAAPVGGL